MLRQLASGSSLSVPLSSPVLINHLSTLTLAIPDFEVDTLLEPIASRRRQVVEKAVARLQLDAQRTLFSTVGIFAVTVPTAWAACLPPLSLITGYAATGLGILGILSGLLLGQRWWQKSQAVFWKDWHRISSMLRGDLEVSRSCPLRGQADLCRQL
jgi:hypothetical protein